MTSSSIDAKLDRDRSLLGDSKASDSGSVRVVDSSESLVDEQGDSILPVSFEKSRAQNSSSSSSSDLLVCESNESESAAEINAGNSRKQTHRIRKRG